MLFMDFSDNFASLLLLHFYVAFIMVILVLENYRVMQDHLKTVSAIGASS